MDYEEFAARTEAIRARLYRTAYLYLGSEADALEAVDEAVYQACLLYTSPSPRDGLLSRMPSSA